MTTKFSLFVLVTAFCFWQCAIAGPTLTPANPFSAEKDAKLVRKAVKGWGTDEDDINKVLCKRTFKQRTEIAASYESSYGESLLTKLKKETSGDLEELYSRLMISAQAVLGDDLHYTIEKEGKDFSVITEIICATDAEEKTLLSTYYKQTYNMDVDEHLDNCKSKEDLYKDVLHNYCWKMQCTTTKLAPAMVLEVAQALASIDAQTDIITFRATLQTYYKNYCSPDLQAIFIKYKSLKNKEIYEVIKETMKDNEAKAWAALTLSTENRYRYYASALHEAVDGAGTDEKRIDRITLQTCEKDLGDIDTEYRNMYEKSFSDRLTGFWTGDAGWELNYKDCMRKLFGK